MKEGVGRWPGLGDAGSPEVIKGRSTNGWSAHVHGWIHMGDVHPSAICHDGSGVSEHQVPNGRARREGRARAGTTASGQRTARAQEQ